MICGQGEQLIGSFQCIQSWCQYSAGSPGSLGEEDDTTGAGKVAQTHLFKGAPCGGPVEQLLNDRVLSPLRGDVLAPGT